MRKFIAIVTAISVTIFILFEINLTAKRTNGVKIADSSQNGAAVFYSDDNESFNFVLSGGSKEGGSFSGESDESEYSDETEGRFPSEFSDETEDSSETESEFQRPDESEDSLQPESSATSESYDEIESETEFNESEPLSFDDSEDDTENFNRTFTITYNSVGDWMGEHVETYEENDKFYVMPQILAGKNFSYYVDEFNNKFFADIEYTYNFGRNLVLKPVFTEAG